MDCFASLAMTMLENDGSIRQIVPHFLDSPEKALARRAFLARLGLAEFRQQFLLPRGELRRCLDVRSEERSVGKECGSTVRSGWSPDPSKIKTRNIKII